jgi:hypothetical protein
MKLRPDAVLASHPPDEFLRDYQQYARFSSADERVVRWFVQVRAILVTQVPPISPRLKDALEYISLQPAVINHPHRRLRGGRMLTEHTNDATLMLGNEGYSQSPVKIPAAYLSDGYGVDPASEPVGDPYILFG